MSSVGEPGIAGPPGIGAMPEVVTCNKCGYQSWEIFSESILCLNCGQREKLYDNVPSTHIVQLVNDFLYGVLVIDPLDETEV